MKELASPIFDPKLKPGEVLEQRYTVLRSLGSGAVGRVFLVSDKELGGQEVALKIPHAQLMQDGQAIERFRNEILLSRQLSHPGIVRIFHSSELSSGLPYFTMEYVAGCDLRQLLAQSVANRLNQEEVHWLMLRIIEGVSFAHSRGIIHRDLKPDNILIGFGGSVKISDFGLAHGVSSGQDITRTGECVGSPLYMAPEQLRGGKYTEASDIYSLGIIAYELLVGKVPFPGDSYLAVARAHIEDEVPIKPLDDRVDNSVLLPFIQRALLKAPEQRFASAKEARDFLDCPPQDSETIRQRVSLSVRKNIRSGPSSYNLEHIFKTVIVCLMLFFTNELLEEQDAHLSFHADILRISRAYDLNIGWLERLLGFKQQPKDHNVALIEAIKQDDVNSIVALAYSGVDFVQRDRSGNTAYHFFALNNHSIGNLLHNQNLRGWFEEKYKANIDIQNSRGETPLFLAIKNYKLLSARQLIGAGASLNIANIDGVTPYHLALASQEVEFIEYVISRSQRASLSLRDANGRTIFENALLLCSQAVFETYLKNVSNDDLRGIGGRTALMFLLEQPHSSELEAKARTLIAAGIGTQGVDNRGHDIDWYLEKADPAWRQVFAQSLEFGE